MIHLHYKEATIRFFTLKITVNIRKQFDIIIIV